jgi:hypothetical protein
MHLHIAGFLLALLLVAVILFGLWEVLGLWLVYGPLALGGLAALAHFGPRLARTGQDFRRRRLDARRMAALDLKRRTAAAEAALGIPVPTEGYCPACGSPLVAAARYCGHCRYAVASGGSGRPGLPLVLCPRCAERQPDGHATYCFACGAILAVPAPHATTSQPRQAAGGPETEQTWPRHGQMS